jgi:hypothetical protein
VVGPEPATACDMKLEFRLDRLAAVDSKDIYLVEFDLARASLN